MNFYKKHDMLTFMKESVVGKSCGAESTIIFKILGFTNKIILHVLRNPSGYDHVILL